VGPAAFASWDLVTAERSTVYRVRAWSRSHAERHPLDDINEVDSETHSIEAERISTSRPRRAPRLRPSRRRAGLQAPGRCVMPLLMLVMLVGGLLLALLAQSWAPLLGAGTVAALMFMGVLLICSVLIIFVLSAVAVGEWWDALRRRKGGTRG
jgi:hypothetical protein